MRRRYVFVITGVGYNELQWHYTFDKDGDIGGDDGCDNKNGGLIVILYHHTT